MATPYAPAELKALNASMGAGVLVTLGPGGCGLRETHRVARFMAAESAGQCGPCLFGLPAIAADLGLLAGGAGGPEVLERLRARCGIVSGRGACRHPDGVVRLVQSALRVFAADLRSHMQGRPCPGSARPTVLQFPGPRARKGTRPAMRIVLNPATCDGFGFCAEVLPEVIGLDEWGYPVVAGGTVPAELIEAARQAARRCPRRALCLVHGDASQRALSGGSARGAPARP